MAPVSKGRAVAGVQPAATGIVARVRQRLFPAGTPSESSRGLSFNASIAEFLLVNRLRARSQRRAQVAEMLDRAAHIVFVTCKNWFTSANGTASGGRTPL